MKTNVIEKTLTEITPADNRDKAREGNLHRGPVVRLLASVTRLAEEHAEYKLSRCEWRRISF